MMIVEFLLIVAILICVYAYIRKKNKHGAGVGRVKRFIREYSRLNNNAKEKFRSRLTKNQQFMLDQLMLMHIEESNRLIDDMNKSMADVDRFMREINQNIEFLNIINEMHNFNNEIRMSDHERHMQNFGI